MTKFVLLKEIWEFIGIIIRFFFPIFNQNNNVSQANKPRMGDSLVKIAIFVIFGAKNTVGYKKNESAKLALISGK